MEKEKIIIGLKKQLKKIDDLLSNNRKNPEFDGWQTKTIRLLERINGVDSSYVKDFKSIRYGLMVFSVNTPDYEFEEAYKKGLERAKSILQNIIEELEELWLPNVNTSKNQNSNINKNQNSITVNINNNLSTTINTILESKLTVSQYKELNEILSMEDKKRKKLNYQLFCQTFQLE